ncbi:MAG: hypothetical protein ACTSPN_16515 [Promethearchaeota archaeon]
MWYKTIVLIINPRDFEVNIFFHKLETNPKGFIAKEIRIDNEKHICKRWNECPPLYRRRYCVAHGHDCKFYQL